MVKFLFERYGLKRRLSRFDIFIITALVIFVFTICQVAWLNQANWATASTRTAIASLDIPLAERLHNEVRILCMVLTSADNHNTRAIHVLRTWGRHCNRLLFFSKEEHGELETVVINVNDDREHLWGKVKAAFSYVHSHYLNEADWFLKVDDDTFVIPENLRYFLAAYDTKMPVYFGCKIKQFGKEDHMAGGAGYVLSKEALNRFITKAIPAAAICRQDSEGLDYMEIEHCLHNVGVRGINSVVSDGGTFFPLPIKEHLFGFKSSNVWYLMNEAHKVNNGTEQMSRHAISFHFVNGQNMHVLYFITYKLRLFGMPRSKITTSRKLSFGEETMSRHPRKIVQPMHY